MNCNSGRNWESQEQNNDKNVNDGSKQEVESTNLNNYDKTNKLEIVLGLVEENCDNHSAPVLKCIKQEEEMDEACTSNNMMDNTNGTSSSCNGTEGDQVSSINQLNLESSDSKPLVSALKQISRPEDIVRKKPKNLEVSDFQILSVKNPGYKMIWMMCNLQNKKIKMIKS